MRSTSHPAGKRATVFASPRTRKTSPIALGVSPRGTLALYRTSQALAAIRGRNYVIPDDIKALVLPVLTHRLTPSLEARLHDRPLREVLAALLEQVPVPVEEVWAPNK